MIEDRGRFRLGGGGGVVFVRDSVWMVVVLWILLSGIPSSGVLGFFVLRCCLMSAVACLFVICLIWWSLCHFYKGRSKIASCIVCHGFSNPICHVL